MPGREAESVKVTLECQLYLSDTVLHRFIARHVHSVRRPFRQNAFGDQVTVVSRDRRFRATIRSDIEELRMHVVAKRRPGATAVDGELRQFAYEWIGKLQEIERRLRVVSETTAGGEMPARVEPADRRDVLAVQPTRAETWAEYRSDGLKDNHRRHYLAVLGEMKDGKRWSALTAVKGIRYPQASVGTWKTVLAELQRARCLKEDPHWNGKGNAPRVIDERGKALLALLEGEASTATR